MIYSVLSGYGPSVEPVYDDRSTAMIIMVIVICVLAVLCIILVMDLMIFLYLWLENRHSKKDNERSVDIKNDEQLTENELQVISEYRELDEQGKELVNNTIQTLNSKAHKD